MIENKEIDRELKKLIIVKQILLASSIGNVQRRGLAY